MFLGVNHGKDAMFGEVGQATIPIALQVLCANLVDLFECTKV